jgi:SAM-dependent methyltransferase
MSESMVYGGRDLEAMSFAVRYHQWILQIFRPYLGTRIVEVGAGIGSFSELILELRPESLSLVEPSKEMHLRLVERVRELNPVPQVFTFNSPFVEIAQQIRVTQRPDSIIYVNVLEHILDDEAELTAASEALIKGGRIFIFVPAMRWLYGGFDRAVGHFRRYTKGEVSEKCRRAGFIILSCRYLDLVGVVPWWLKYRLLNSNRLETPLVKMYDAYVVPVTKLIERFINPPIGKNIVLIAERR